MTAMIKRVYLLTHLLLYLCEVCGWMLPKSIKCNVVFFSCRFRVKFDDGTSKWVDAAGLLLAKELPIGQSVMVMSEEDGYYVCGMVMKHSLVMQEDEGDDGAAKIIYLVERDDGKRQR